MAKANQTVTIKSDEKDPEPLELIAKSIIEIANAFQQINSSRLKRRVIVLLLQDATGIKIRDIEMLLDTAPKLKDIYIKQLPK